MKLCLCDVSVREAAGSGPDVCQHDFSGSTTDLAWEFRSSQCKPQYFPLRRKNKYWKDCSTFSCVLGQPSRGFTQKGPSL